MIVLGQTRPKSWPLKRGARWARPCNCHSRPSPSHSVAPQRPPYPLGPRSSSCPARGHSTSTPRQARWPSACHAPPAKSKTKEDTGPKHQASTKCHPARQSRSRIKQPAQWRKLRNNAPRVGGNGGERVKTARCSRRRGVPQTRHLQTGTRRRGACPGMTWRACLSRVGRVDGLLCGPSIPNPRRG